MYPYIYLWVFDFFLWDQKIQLHRDEGIAYVLDSSGDVVEIEFCITSKWINKQFVHLYIFDSYGDVQEMEFYVLL